MSRAPRLVRPGLWAAAATGVQVGAAIVATRHVAHEVPPLTLAMLRYAIGFACLAPFAWASFRAFRQYQKAASAIKPVADTPARDLCVMAALGIGQFGILIALMNFGLQHVSAARAALIFSLFPLLTLLLSVAVGRERMHLALAAGVALSLGGVALALGPKLVSVFVGNGPSGYWGELAVLASAGVGALCSVLYRPYLLRYPTVPVSAYAMLASVLFLALVAWPEAWPQRLGALTLPVWMVVAFIGLSSGVGYFLWLYALKHEPPTQVTVFLALNPVTAALLGAGLLGEPLDGWTGGAIVLIGLGLWFATRPAPPRSG